MAVEGGAGERRKPEARRLRLRRRLGRRQGVQGSSGLPRGLPAGQTARAGRAAHLIRRPVASHSALHGVGVALLGSESAGGAWESGPRVTPGALGWGRGRGATTAVQAGAVECAPAPSAPPPTTPP